ncbi:MAG: Maf family nucleotide pyrophosphatase [Chitinophagaceae bacterium]
MYQKIILASQSPRRKQLLELAQVPFEIVLPGIEEIFPNDLSPDKVPLYLAMQKANAVKKQITQAHESIPILAADTIVLYKNTILGKPANEEEAMDMLGQLSGNEHRVITGVSLLKENENIGFSAVTKVFFHPLKSEQIRWYVKNFQPYDKAGAYAIQEWIGLAGISAIEGDYYNVMGLPVSLILPHLLLQQSL